MKKQLLHSTMLALALVMASTGCKHKPERVTPLGEPPPPSVGEVGNQQTMNAEPPVQTGPGSTGIAETDNRPLSDYNQDPNTLAAYSVHFAFDSAVVRDSEKDNLQKVAQQLQSDPSAKLLVAGNCDERGTEEYNRSLGERRALAAREALVGLGLSADRIRTISYGKDQPVDTGHDEAAWSKNRRDDFIILHLKTGA
jgi:peptidoglycan-associated lipoprotein